MEPTSGPDNTRPSTGLARFWQVQPETDSQAGGDEPLETPAEVFHGSPLGTFRSRPIPPLAPIASAARHPSGAADPFELYRPAGRGPFNPAGIPQGSGQAPPQRHGDTDHSLPPEDQPDPGQDVKSQEPEGGSFGGFGLGGRAGRVHFGGWDDHDEHDPGDRDHGNQDPGERDLGEQDLGERDGPEEHAGTDGEAGRTGPEPGATVTEDEPQVGDEPTDEETAGVTPVDESADRDPPEAGQDPAAVAGSSDENGREDMNGRAGAPGYAQTGEAAPDGTGDTAENARGHSPAEPARPVAGWATVPGATRPVTPTSGGPVSGVPVSPAYSPNPYTVADFTPDHPAGTLQPGSGLPEQVSEPADPAGSAPVSPASAPVQAQAQIPASRTAPDLAIGRAVEAPEPTGYPGLPPVTEAGYGFAATGYSLGRTPEAFGVASVSPQPGTGSVTPPPEFQAYPSPGDTSLTINVPARPETPATRRSASLEDVEPMRRPGRRAARAEEPETFAATVADAVAEEPLLGRTVWDEDAARHFRAAWHEVKAEFVDDPVTALTRAHDLLTDAVNELTEVLLAERDELDPLRSTGTPDTESMRMAMRGYREFLERILSL